MLSAGHEQCCHATPAGEAIMSRKLWGAQAIGAAINRTPKQTFYLLNKGLIRSAQRIGTQWVADADDLHCEFSARSAYQDEGRAAS